MNKPYSDIMVSIVWFSHTQGWRNGFLVSGFPSTSLSRFASSKYRRYIRLVGYYVCIKSMDDVHYWSSHNWGDAEWGPHNRLLCPYIIYTHRTGSQNSQSLSVLTYLCLACLLPLLQLPRLIAYKNNDSVMRPWLARLVRCVSETSQRLRLTAYLLRN